jgi:peptidyl-prolyl cis-trans isomerase C
MSKIVAKVGTFSITDDEVTEYLMNMGQRGQNYNNPEGRRAILDRIVAGKLMLLDAKRNLLQVEPAFKAQLARLKDELLANYATEKLIAEVKVTDKECRDYYEANKEQFLSEEQVEASHILVKEEELANKLLEDIKSGKISFEDCAKESSTCPSGKMGGALGAFGRGQMVKEFEDAAFSMNPGDITDAPVKTQFGYHIIKVTSKRNSETIPYESIADEIMGALKNEKSRKAYESKINQLKILYPVDYAL